MWTTYRGDQHGSEVSTVVSVRLRDDQLAKVEAAASARAEAIQIEARNLVALLHGDVA